jgi:nitrate reductase assembly molybdenum cofactor insertion protein NarJ
MKTYAELVDDVENARETLEDIADATSALRGTQEHRDARKAYAVAIDALTAFNAAKAQS